MFRRSLEQRATAARPQDDASSAARAPRPDLHPLAVTARLAVCGAALAMAAWSADALAQDGIEEVRHYEIPAGSLTVALNRYAQAAGVFLSAPAALTEGKLSTRLSGDFTIDSGFAALLHGQGLQAVPRSNGSYALRQIAASASTGDADNVTEAALPAVSVSAQATSLPGDPPRAYAGGQVASGARLGMLGNRDVLDTPFNVTSFTAQTISNQQARGLADLVVNDPSVRTTFAEASFVPTFQIRGFTASSWDVSLDGLFGVLPPQSVTLDSAERVEILKGPSALLNGLPPQGSVGGVINVVPKRAQDTPNASVTTTFASRRQPGVAVDLGRRFGEDDQIGVRFSGSYRNGDTAVQNQSQELGSAALGLDYRGKRVRLSADLGYQHQDMDAPLRPLWLSPGVPVPKAPDATANWSQPWTFSNVRDQYYALHGEVDLDDHWTLSAAAGGRKNQAYYVFANPSVLNAAGDITESPFNYPQYTTTNTQQIGLQGRFDTGAVHHALSLSASRYHAEFGSSLQLLGPFSSNIYDPVFVAKPAFGEPATPRTSASDFSGIAIGDTLSVLNERLQLLLGVRRQKVESKNFDGASGAVTSHYDKVAYTPSVGLIIKPWSDRTSLYANYIEGLQQGATVAAGYANAGELLPPYRSKQYEIGAKRDWGRITTTVSLFQITQPGALVTASNRYEADGEQRNRGVELNVFGELAPSVRVLGGIMLLDGKLTKTAGGGNDGRTAPGAPRVQTNFGVEYDTAFAPGLTLSGTVINTSGQYYDTANTQHIPGWTRLDVGASYRTHWIGHALTLRGNVRNLFNRGYWASANTNNGGLAPGAPRTVLLSAMVDF